MFAALQADRQTERQKDRLPKDSQTNIKKLDRRTDRMGICMRRQICTDSQSPITLITDIQTDRKNNKHKDNLERQIDHRIYSFHIAGDNMFHIADIVCRM